VVKKIIKRIQAREHLEFSGFAIDTSEKLKDLSNIPSANKVLIGKSMVKGHGTGRDVSLGKKIVTEELGLVMNKLSKAVKEKPWVIILITGLGGGTGTGGFPTVAKKVKDTYKCKTLGLFVLPSAGEGRVYTKNAFKNLDKLFSSVDGSIIIDNNVLTDKGDDILSARKSVNQIVLGFFRLINEAFIERFFGFHSTISYYKVESDHISVKEAIEKMMRDHLFLKFDMKKSEEMLLVARGNLEYLYGHDFALGWAKNKFGLELEFEFFDEVGSRSLEAGLLIRETKDLNGRFDEIREVVSKKDSSELDDLFKDIHSIF
jgi:cell division GTPase FtsZ